jgi:hypothetical protein
VTPGRRGRYPPGDCTLRTAGTLGLPRAHIHHVGEGGAVCGQDRGDTVHDVFRLGGHVVADDLAVGVPDGRRA